MNKLAFAICAIHQNKNQSPDLSLEPIEKDAIFIINNLGKSGIDVNSAFSDMEATDWAAPLKTSCDPNIN